MSQWEKLRNGLHRMSSDLQFEELQKILIEYGYKPQIPRTGSSHYTFRKDGKNPITIPRHRPIKATYIRLVKDVVEKENENGKQDN